MDLSFVHGVITTLQQHQPWIVDKVGSSLVTQNIKEIWEQVKAKLGSKATLKVEETPDDAGQWELLKAKLLVALNEDEVFQEKLCALAQQSEKSASISQYADGNDNKQVGVHESSNVKVSIK